MKLQLMFFLFLLNIFIASAAAYDKECVTTPINKIAVLDDFGQNQDQQIQVQSNNGWFWLNAASNGTTDRVSQSILAVALSAKATGAEVQLCYDNDNLVNGNLRKIVGIILL